MAWDFALPARVQGWTRRPKRGETYGATYVEPYYDTIATLYARGNVEKNSQVSPDQVREQLVRLHPDKFCLLGVWALQNCFTALGQKKANGGAGGGVHRGRVRAARRSVPCAGQDGRGGCQSKACLRACNSEG